MKVERSVKGIWIPIALWENRELSVIEKIMMLEIDSLEHEVRGCYASNAHFAGFFDLSISRVSEVINGLAKKGLVDIEQVREGKRVVERRIRVIKPENERRKPDPDPSGKPNTPPEKALNPSGKGDEPPSENTKGSNTNILSNTKSSKTLADVGQQAFEIFWKANGKLGSMKKARELFLAYCKANDTEPMAFALILVNDIAARRKVQQFGFDKLHGATYLRQERWNDTMQAAETGKPSAFPTDFAGKTYKGTANDAFADFLQDDPADE